jgi:hypothetical protein
MVAGAHISRTSRRAACINYNKRSSWSEGRGGSDNSGVPIHGGDGWCPW